MATTAVHTLLGWVLVVLLSWTSSGDIPGLLQVVSYQGHGLKKVYASQLLGILGSSTLVSGRSYTPVSVLRTLTTSLNLFHRDKLKLVISVVRY